MRENSSIIVDRVNFHTVFEGLEVELLEQGSFGSLNLFVLRAHLEIFGDFDLTLDDLGGDVQSVEEVDLRGIESSGTCGDAEIDGGNHTDSGFSGDFVGFNLSLKIVDRGFGEDQGDLLFKKGDKDAQLRDFSSELLFELLELFFFDAFSSHSNDFLDEGLSDGVRTFLEMTR